MLFICVCTWLFDFRSIYLYSEILMLDFRNLLLVAACLPWFSSRRVPLVSHVGCCPGELAYTCKVTEKEWCLQLWGGTSQTTHHSSPIEEQHGEGKDIVNWVWNCVNDQKTEMIEYSRSVGGSVPANEREYDESVEDCCSLHNQTSVCPPYHEGRDQASCRCQSLQFHVCWRALWLNWWVGVRSSLTICSVISSNSLRRIYKSISADRGCYLNEIACCARSDYFFCAFRYLGIYHGFTMSEANPLEGDTFCHK